MKSHARFAMTRRTVLLLGLAGACAIAAATLAMWRGGSGAGDPEAAALNDAIVRRVAAAQTPAPAPSPSETAGPPGHGQVAEMRP